MTTGTEGETITINLTDTDGEVISHLDINEDPILLDDPGVTVTATITLTDQTTETRTVTVTDATTGEATYTVSSGMASQGWIDEDITIDWGDGTTSTSLETLETTIYNNIINIQTETGETYDPNRIQRLITWAISHIQRKTGRYFIETEFTQTEYKYYGSSIFLEHTPVMNISSFTLDGATLTGIDYNLNTETGEISFEYDAPYLSDYTITYTVMEDPEGDIFQEAADICTDLVLAKLESQVNSQNISSFRDGDFTVNYQSQDPVIEIESRITALKKQLLFII